MNSRHLAATNQHRFGRNAIPVLSGLLLLAGLSGLASAAAPGVGELLALDGGQDSTLVVYAAGPGLEQSEVHRSEWPVHEVRLRNMESVGLLEASWLELGLDGDRSLVSVSRDGG